MAKAKCNTVNGHASTGATLTQAHAHGTLMVQQVQVALLGGALSLCDFLITWAAGALE